MNIKSLVLEEPMPVIAAVQFDPERDIEGSDWERVKTYLEGVEESGFVDEAIRALILFPQKRSELEPKLRAERTTRIGMLENVSDKARADPKELPTVAIYAVDIKLAYPGYMKTVKRSYEPLWQKSMDYLERLKANPEGFDAFIRFTYDLAILYPQPELRGYLKLDDGVREKLRQEIAERRQADVGILFAETAARFKILFPDDELEISDRDWKRLKEQMDEYRKPRPAFLGQGTAPPDTNGFLYIGAPMAILSADRVNITDEDFELIRGLPVAPFNQPVLNLPAVRKF